MPLYAVSSGRGQGLRFQGVPPRGAQICRNPTQFSHEASDEDDDDIDWPAHSPSDSSPSVNEFILNQQENLSEVESASVASPTVSRHSSAYDELPRFGLVDSDLSEPDFLGVGETDDSHVDSDSDGDLSNVNELDLDDEEELRDIPNPPQLPSVSEERLQEVWPLGDSSFGIFTCPITHDVMTDPVVCADGYTYERAAIGRWFETSRKSPVTGQTLPHVELVPNQSVRTLLKTLIDMTEGKHQAACKTLAHQLSPECSERTASPEKPSQAEAESQSQSLLRARPAASAESEEGVGVGDDKACLCRPTSPVDTETDLARGSSSSSSSSSSSGALQSDRRSGTADSRHRRVIGASEREVLHW